MDAVEAAVCDVMRGSSGSWRHVAQPEPRLEFLAVATRHRVRPLLAWRIRQSSESAQWPPDILRALADAERSEAALEIVRSHELRRVTAAFHAARVPVVVMKGAALACSLYPEPWLRPREDTDLLIDPDHRDRAATALESAGYRAAPMQSGRLVTHQRLFVRVDGAGRRHACDVHWKIADPAPFADLLSPADVLSDSETCARAGTPVRIPSRVHALLLASWHRVSHHRASRDLLWLYDLHLLAAGLAATEADRVAAILHRTRTAAVCADGMRLAAERFGTRVPAALIGHASDAAPTPASIAAYLRPDARKVELLAADLRALPDWRSRVRLLREHLFPPASYMRAAPDARGVPLAALYARRIVGGARAWFRRDR